MNFIKDLFAGGASKLVDSVGNALDKVITTREEKLQLENEIKKAEFDFQVEMQKLSVEERKAQYQEMDSARKREQIIAESQYATKLSKNVSSYLAIGATVLCFTMFYIIVFAPELIKANDSVKDIVIYILGVLSALLTQVYSYYFGSSSGSSSKSQTIEGVLRRTVVQQDSE